MVSFSAQTKYLTIPEGHFCNRSHAPLYRYVVSDVSLSKSILETRARAQQPDQQTGERPLLSAVGDDASPDTPRDGSSTRKERGGKLNGPLVCRRNGATTSPDCSDIRTNRVVSETRKSVETMDGDFVPNKGV